VVGMRTAARTHAARRMRKVRGRSGEIRDRQNEDAERRAPIMLDSLKYLAALSLSLRVSLDCLNRRRYEGKREGAGTRSIAMRVALQQEG